MSAVYTAIAAVMADLATTGISKSRRNKEQGYSYRGVDDAYNTLAPVFARHKLVILPRILTRHCDERKSSKGNPLFFVSVEAEYDIVSAEDGSRHTTRAFGEGMDSADKATIKAMSSAYKSMVFQTFCVPTEADNDADATTHDVAPPEDAALLATLKSAAAKGSTALREALDAAGRAKPAVKAMWKQHGQELVATASSADEMGRQ